MVSLTSRSPRLTKTASGSNILKTSNYQTKMDDDQRSASTSIMNENNLPRYMNPTIGNIRKHEEQIEEEVV